MTFQLGSATETVTPAPSSGRWSADGEKGAIFRAGSSAGDLWLAVTTDIADAGDTDWLATGLWAADSPGRLHRRTPLRRVRHRRRPV